jgi:hypothetical protein
MSQTPFQTQTPNFKSFFVYTREELEKKLEDLRQVMRNIMQKLHEVKASLDDVAKYLREHLGYKYDDIINEIIGEIEYNLLDAIDDIIINKLQLDTDIEKYEKLYKVSFPYETERQLGVALVRDGETKPVVVYTDYQTVDYYEGERDE